MYRLNFLYKNFFIRFERLKKQKVSELPKNSAHAYIHELFPQKLTGASVFLPGSAREARKKPTHA